MQDKKSLIEIINLLRDLRKIINSNINTYNYYIDIILDRFPDLENSKEFKRIEIQEVKNEEKSRRI